MILVVVRVVQWVALEEDTLGIAKVGRAEMWFMAALAAEQGAV
jgi:hypothetical protein